MDKLLIHGGRRLQGEVRISGAKNAALPILCAGLLVPGTLELSNVPQLHDVGTTLKLLDRMGVKSTRDAAAGTVTLDGVDHEVKVGEAIDIPQGAAHRMANLGETLLIFIEVQRGSYLGEDDIERLQDDFGRSS